MKASRLPVGRRWPGGETGSQAARLKRSWLLLLFWAALLPHLVIALLFFNYPIALDDMFQYDMLARSLNQGVGYRWYSTADIEVLRPYLKQFLDLSHMHTGPDGLLTTFRAPGYPFFLAGLYRLVSPGTRFGLVRLVQALLLSLLAPGTALLAIRMGMARKTALLAGAAMALYPLLLLYPAGLASENLFIPLVLAGFLALLWAASYSSLWPTLIAGGLLGAAMLTRSILAPFVLLAGVWTWRYRLSRRAGGAALLLAIAFGVCLPWAVRNSLQSGRVAFVETGLSYQMYIGYHPEGDGGFLSRIAIGPLAILDDAQRDQFCAQAVARFIQGDPLGSAARIFRRAVYFMSMEDRELAYFYSNGFFGAIPQPWLTLAYLLLVIPWAWTVVYAILGLSIAPRPAAWLALALLAGYTLPHLLIIAEPRFHLALIPILLPFAAHGWYNQRNLLTTLKRNPTRNTAIWVAGIGLAIALTLWVWGLTLRWDLLIALLSPDGYHLRLSY